MLEQFHQRFFFINEKANHFAEYILLHYASTQRTKRFYVSKLHREHRDFLLRQKEKLWHSKMYGKGTRFICFLNKLNMQW